MELAFFLYDIVSGGGGGLCSLLPIWYLNITPPSPPVFVMVEIYW